MKKSITVQIDVDDLQKIDNLHGQTAIPKTVLIGRAISDYLDRIDSEGAQSVLYEAMQKNAA